MLSQNQAVQSFPVASQKQRDRASKALSNARQRCSNPKNKDFASYGALGIKVLFDSVDDLLDAIGPPPDKASLDRINPKGHYEKGNVRWASKAVQAANKKSSVIGSIPPLAVVIAEQQLIQKQLERRPKIAAAWGLVLKAFNRGSIPLSEDAVLADALGLTPPASATLTTKEVNYAGQSRMAFRLPSLTCPGEFVTALGRSSPLPDEEVAARYTERGLLCRFRDKDAGSTNLRGDFRNALTDVFHATETPGLTLVGRPSQTDLENGWFEVSMLAAATRLSASEAGQAVLYPAMTCLDMLADLGSPYNWHKMPHLLLDAPWLFVPDFQLDCGPGSHLNYHQSNMLAALLEYRVKAGHKTVVGIQAADKLMPRLKLLLLGSFIVREVQSTTASVANLVFSGSAADVGMTGETGPGKTAENLEKC